jgi:predicted PurR-regulated permease PerM
LTGVPHAFLFALLTMMLAMVPLGAWTALALAVLALLAKGGTFAGRSWSGCFRHGDVVDR